MEKKALSVNKLTKIPESTFPEVPDNFIRMDLSISKYPPAPNVEKALIKSIKSINQYPESNWHLLLTKIADMISLAKQNILLANGLDEAIDLITRTFVCPNARVIIPIPTFAQFEIAALRQTAILVKLPSMTEFGFQIDSNQVIEAAHDKNTQLVWRC